MGPPPAAWLPLRPLSTRTLLLLLLLLLLLTHRLVVQSGITACMLDGPLRTLSGTAWEKVTSVGASEPGLRARPPSMHAGQARAPMPRQERLAASVMLTRCCDTSLMTVRAFVCVVCRRHVAVRRGHRRHPQVGDAARAHAAQRGALPQLLRQGETAVVTVSAATFALPRVAAIHAVVPPVVSRSLARAPCNELQFAKAFVARYNAAIFRCKRIGELGAQQLLLDLQATRSILQNAPALKDTSGSGVRGGAGTAGDDDELFAGATGADADGGEKVSVPAIYTRTILRELPRVEMLFKIISAPRERLAETIRTLWPEATEKDLNRVMELRGLNPRERNVRGGVCVCVCAGTSERCAVARQCTNCSAPSPARVAAGRAGPAGSRAARCRHRCCGCGGRRVRGGRVQRDGWHAGGRRQAERRSHGRHGQDVWPGDDQHAQAVRGAGGGSSVHAKHNHDVVDEFSRKSIKFWCNNGPFRVSMSEWRCDAPAAADGYSSANAASYREVAGSAFSASCTASSAAATRVLASAASTLCSPAASAAACRSPTSDAR